MMKPIYETLQAERNRNNPDDYQSFEIWRDTDTGRVHFEHDKPIYALMRYGTPAEVAETLRWMADEIAGISPLPERLLKGGKK
jgi:hypothetical protein